ncbi:MAG: hypothetical protein C5B52_15310 [Bacteroidetes bacterium]|nr:MAG: hypothetical protein C5B52_15310 [Bacteroidota bacterium]
MIAKTPSPPYYAVIFTSLKFPESEGYHEMAERMAELAATQPGYLGYESARDEIGITVSYWENLDSIRNWKQNLEHLEAQRKGKENWYVQYKARICKVERDYGFELALATEKSRISK